MQTTFLHMILLLQYGALKSHLINLAEIFPKELVRLYDAKCKWTLGCYRYPEMKKNLMINHYT